jgi:transposase
MRGKKIWGRKRHFLVDSLGLPIALLVESAQWHDSFGAEVLLLRAKGHVPRLTRIWADAAYQGQQFVSWVKEHLQVEVNQAQQRPSPPIQHRLVCSPTGHCQMMPTQPVGSLGQRWVVERAFAWASRVRRLARDVEGLPASSEAFITLAFSRIVLRRLAPGSA